VGANSGRGVEREGRLSRTDVIMSGTKLFCDYLRLFIVMKGIRPLLWYCRSDLRQMLKKREEEQSKYDVVCYPQRRIRAKGIALAV